MISPIYKPYAGLNCLITKALPIFLLAFVLGSTELKAQVLTCPANYVINLPQNECEVAIYYDSLVWSASIPVSDPVFFPFPGTFLPTGITTITLAVSGNNNNFYTCTFEVNILAYQSTNFNCPGVALVSLDGECERMLTATDILGETFNPCDEDYTTEIQIGNNWVPGIIDAEDVGTTFNVRLTNFETGHTCTTLVTVIGGEPPSITCPPNRVQFCNEPTVPSYTGEPALTGCFDNVTLTHTDVLTSTMCPDTFAFQIVRTWSATSPNGSQTSCHQNITGKRFPIGLVVFPADLDDITSPALSCNDSLNLAATAHPDITGWPLVGDFQPTDNVHCRYAVSYLDNTNNLCGDSYHIKRIWTVVQICGSNIRRDTQTILVLDNKAPVFEIPDTVYFSNAGGCVDSVHLPAATVLSECSNYSLLLQSDWGNFTTNGAWIHPDTVAGNYLINYKLTDACGNDTTQTLVLKIADETLVACPPSDTVTCDYFFSVISPALQIQNYDVLNVHGLPNFYNNCSYSITQDATSNVDGCGNGVVTRNIHASNPEDTLSCVQSIIVEHVSNFIVQFPADISLCVAPTPANLPEPVITLANCEALAVSFIDMNVPSGITGCYTLQRTWFLINSCVYAGTPDGSDTAVGERRFQDNGDGYMEYTQNIHVNNNAPITYPNGCEIPDLYLDADDCIFDMLVPQPEVLGCGSNINLTVSGSLGNNLGASVGITPGTYSVSYNASDECGKMQACLTMFEVFDTISPVARCKQQLTITLSANCSANVQVGDFDDGSTDNCDNNVALSFNPNANVQALVFNACDLGLQLIDLWVTDDEGNKSNCQSELMIQGSTNCDCDPALGGQVVTALGIPIRNVKVLLTSPGKPDRIDYTDANGNYYFGGIVIGDDYQITPAKDTFPLNGVTTFDLVTIRRHILLIDLLGSPHKMIAADVNKSGSITTFDLVEISKLILLIHPAFPNNKSWRFVDAAYTFPNPQNPFGAPFPESRNVNDVLTAQLNINFVGIKVGDVNNSASTSPIVSPDDSLEKND